jgi:hypothetical protein
MTGRTARTATAAASAAGFAARAEPMGRANARSATSAIALAPAPSFFVYRSWRSAGLSLIPTDEDRFCDRVLARLSLNITTGRAGLYRKMVRREGEQPEVIMMRSMAMRWTWAAIAHFPKIVGRLLHFHVLRGAVRQFRQDRWNIVNRPMMPCAGGRIGIVAEQDKTSRFGWRAGPLQRRRQVFSIAGEASRNCRSVGEGV